MFQKNRGTISDLIKRKPRARGTTTTPPCSLAVPDNNDSVDDGRFKPSCERCKISIRKACSPLFFLSLVVFMVMVLKIVSSPSQIVSSPSPPSSSSYTSCLEETLRNLPIGKGPRHKRKRLVDKNQLLVWAHHFDARNPQWNKDIRFDPIPELQNNNEQQHCSVWEVGAHTQAADTKEFLQHYPHCDYHAYEPIPTFAKKLSQVWQSTTNVHTHSYGIGEQNGGFNVPKELLNGQGTYIGDATTTSTQQQGEEWATIESFEKAIQDAGGNKPTVLHMNCEGCEWTLLPEGVASGFINDIPVLQIGFHNYGDVGLGQRTIEYCQIREQLSQTHRLVDGAVPFAWERWVLKK